MKFDKPAGENAIDRMTVIGLPHDRIEGALKTTGLAPYAYEHTTTGARPAYGYILGSAIAKGRIRAMDLSKARSAAGVLAVVTAQEAGKLGKGKYNTAPLLGGPEIAHYHQAIAVVVAETFEQARAATALIHVDYAREDGRFDLAEGLKSAPFAGDPNTGAPAKEERTGHYCPEFSERTA